MAPLLALVLVPGGALQLAELAHAQLGLAQLPTLARMPIPTLRAMHRAAGFLSTTLTLAVQRQGWLADLP